VLDVLLVKAHVVYLERYVHTPLRKYDASKLFCGMSSIPLLCIYSPCTSLARECDRESCEGTRVRKRDKERWNKTDETEREELVEVHRVSKLLLYCPHLWILLKIESIFTQQKCK